MNPHEIIITPELIRQYHPCYDPGKYLSEDYSEDMIQFLRHPEIPACDKIWLATRRGILDDKTLRLFSVWCTRDALSRVDNPDPQSIEACDVAERYAHGEATKEELSAAWAAAWAATWAAAWDAAWAAARAAAGAAGAAAEAAARAAAGAAARDAAGAAAWDAAEAAHIEHLIEMLLEEK